MSDLLERAAARVSFGLEDVEPVGVDLSLVGPGSVGAFSTGSGIYFGSEPAHSWAIMGSPSWLPQAAVRLGYLSTLGPGWDGSRAVPVNRRLLDGVWALLKQLSQYVLVAPAIVPTVTGGVALEWHRDEFDLELEFGGDEPIVCYEDVHGRDLEGPLTEHSAVVAEALARVR